jgi:hypothetical protein
MRKHKNSGLFVALIGLTFAGCADSADSLALQQIDNYNKLADAIETDKPTADLQASYDQIYDTNERMKSLSASEKRRMIEKYAPEFAKMLQRVVAAMQTRALGPGADAVKNQIQAIQEFKPLEAEPKKARDRPLGCGIDDSIPPVPEPKK